MDQNIKYMADDIAAARQYIAARMGADAEVPSACYKDWNRCERALLGWVMMQGQRNVRKELMWDFFCWLRREGKQ